MARPTSRSNSPSTGSAAWRRCLRWMAPTSAIRRWAAARLQISTWTRSRNCSPVPDGCRRRLGAARPGSPTSSRVPAAADFTDRFLSFCATRRSMRGITLTIHRSRNRAASRPSAETSSDSRTVGRCCCRICTTGAAEPSISASIKGSGRCWEQRRCWRCRRPQSVRDKTRSPIPDGSTDTLQVPVNPQIAAVLARYPLPNNPTGAYGDRTYAAPSNVDTDADQFSIRIDQKLGAEGSVSRRRFTYDNLTGPTTNPDQTLLDPSFGVQYIDRQRNVAFTYTRTVSPRYLWSASLSIMRTTPSFPTPNHTQPALKFTDGLFEPFNAAAGSVMSAFGNLFQGQLNFAWTSRQHAVKWGVEARLNRDTTYFGTSPKRGVRLRRRNRVFANLHSLGERAA